MIVNLTKLLTFAACLCGLLILFESVPGQKQTDSNDIPQIDCRSLIEKAEKAYKGRAFSSEALGASEHRLKEAIATCPSEAPSDLAAKLREIREQQAEHLSSIASFYWKKFQEDGSGLNAAYFRLREIAEKYPDYSRIGDVLYLLADSYIKMPDDYLKNSAEDLEVLQKKFATSPSVDHISFALQQVRLKIQVRELSQPH